MIGLFGVVLGVMNWREFEAQWSRFRLRIAHESPTPPSEIRAADVRIRRIEPTGGQDGFVHFRVELVNDGTRRADVSVSANVDGNPVLVGTRHVSVPDTTAERFDLIPNGAIDMARVLVPRPSLGDLMLPEIQTENTTLYGRSLEVVAAWDSGEVRASWHEPVFDPAEDAARAEVQKRYWARARNEPSADAPPDLVLKIRGDQWDNFQHLGRILEIEAEIVNATARPKRIIGFALRTESGGGTTRLDAELWREVERRKQQRQRLDAVSVIDPMATVRGWLVYRLPLAPEIKGPIPYTLSVRDEVNLDYDAVR